MNMSKHDNTKSTNMFARLTVGAALGFAAFLFFKNDRPQQKNVKQQVTKDAKDTNEEMFI